MGLPKKQGFWNYLKLTRNGITPECGLLGSFKRKIAILVIVFKLAKSPLRIMQREKHKAYI